MATIAAFSAGRSEDLTSALTHNSGLIGATLGQAITGAMGPKFSRTPPQGIIGARAETYREGAFTLNAITQGTGGNPRPQTGQLYPRGI